MKHTFYKLVVGPLQTNCYILPDQQTNNCIVVDPGGDYEHIKAFLDEKGLIPSFIINTHGHPDHIMDNSQFNIPVYMHEADTVMAPQPDKKIKHKEIIKLDNLSLSAIHTPGHTPGGVCFLFEDMLFSGDTLFAHSIGRTDLPFGDHKQIIKSIKDKLLVLPPETKVYPGHGPETTIMQEKTSNPWLQ